MPPKTPQSLRHEKSLESNTAGESSPFSGRPATVRGIPKSPRRPFASNSPAPSVRSTQSAVDRIPRSPWKPKRLGVDMDQPVCDNPFISKLHRSRGHCQVCVFRLSDSELKVFERKGRHLRVNNAYGGCLNCKVFPSLEDEEPVRICRQCFFDTHLLAKPKTEAFSGVCLAGASGDLKSPSPRRRIRSFSST